MQAGRPHAKSERAAKDQKQSPGHETAVEISAGIAATAFAKSRAIHAMPNDPPTASKTPTATNFGKTLKLCS